jgi:uncharacterized membrane protein YjdF
MVYILSKEHIMRYTLKHPFLPTTTVEKISFFLRVIAVATGVLQLVFGEKGIGLFTLLCVAAITVPSFVTRGKVKTIPIEFELMFIVMVLLQLVIGETLDFYNNVPNYDKFVHFSLPFFIGFMSFIIAYTLDQTNKLSLSPAMLMFVLVFFTLGVGAFWEILEYTSDRLLDPILPNLSQLQGNSVETAIHDTMQDLILDLIGGIFGAVLGLWYILRKDRLKAPRFRKLVRDLARDLS